MQNEEQISETSLAFEQPPKAYSPIFYQKLRCAICSWGNTIYILKTKRVEMIICHDCSITISRAGFSTLHDGEAFAITRKF